ncbi:MAG: helix-turn-helix domain-containing protein [Acidimicrobiia bacterium]
MSQLAAGALEVEVDEAERERITALAALLGDGSKVTLLMPGGKRVELPAALLQLVARGATELAMGRRVALVPSAAELTPNQAARLLGVSRPFLVRLLEDGTIPSRRLERSRHRRIRLEDLLAFDQDRQARRSGINQIVDEALNAGATY